MAQLLLSLLMAVSFSVALSEFLIRDNAWHAWKQFHDKKYESDDEEHLRYTIWNENLKYIKKHNAEGNSKFRLEMNHLGDMVCKTLLLILFIFLFFKYVFKLLFHDKLSYQKVALI